MILSILNNVYPWIYRQVEKPWQASEVLSGTGATIFRNSFLFGSFVIYMDISKQIVPGGLSPFLTGTICSNLAWLTIWPLDVVKTQVSHGMPTLLSLHEYNLDVYRTNLIVLYISSDSTLLGQNVSQKTDLNIIFWYTNDWDCLNWNFPYLILIIFSYNPATMQESLIPP
jgi:hypothetical protein